MPDPTDEQIDEAALREACIATFGTADPVALRAHAGLRLEALCRELSQLRRLGHLGGTAADVVMDDLDDALRGLGEGS